MEPVDLVELLAQRGTLPTLVKEDEHRVVDRLTRKFGLGDRPKVRKELYKWLGRLADQHGEKVLDVISVAVAQAVSARSPGRYFSTTVVRILRERGLISPSRTGGTVQW